ncbi:MAG: hypothetical protein ACE5ID_12745, partial [Acidobacteriota bacterium]
MARFAFRKKICLLTILVLAGACGSPSPAPEETARSTRYEDLVELFHQWREFQKPRLVDGVADYTAAAMAAQYHELGAYRRRLDGIDPRGWSIPRQVDYKLVGAEMNGLDFDHRVRRPWARNPAFYRLIHAARSDVPAHEGPSAYPAIDVWIYKYPLYAERAAELEERIGTIPQLLRQARGNLVEDARGLWRGGIRAMKAQNADLEALAGRAAGREALVSTIHRARQATDEFRGWLEQELPSKKGPSGVGKDNYTWYLQKVHLVPYTWEEEVTIMRSELARAHATLRLEEHRNRDLPPLRRVESAGEYNRRFNAAVTEYMTFLKEKEILTVRDYMEPALRAHIGSFSPSSGLRGFFSEISYRSPLAMTTHSHHWIELAVLDNDPHSSPIRRGPLLYNIFDARSEGLATGMEEMMMQAGLLDKRPRARELIWIMLAQRAARALSGLFLHSNDFSMEEAVQFASQRTPRGWMPSDSET